MKRRNRKEVLFVPDWRKGNPYLECLSAELIRLGFKIVFDHFPCGYFKLMQLANAHSTIGVIHLHWIPSFLDQLLWSRNWFKFNVRLLILALDMLLCRARGVRIIWTLHNLVEHESLAPDQELRARALLARLANAVIGHSSEALEMAATTYNANLSRHGHVIPHGNYIGRYSLDEKVRESLCTKYGIEHGNVVILFFGAVRRYKGLDFLLATFRKVANERLRLIIAGRPFEEKVRKWITVEAAKDGRVRLSLGFVKENEIAAHFALANAVILPFRRVLTSGSVILAMSFGKCLILPESARVLGVPGDAGALYYEDQAALEKLLNRLGEYDTAGMGRNNLTAAQRLEWKEIAIDTAEVYANVRKTFAKA